MHLSLFARKFRHKTTKSIETELDCLYFYLFKLLPYIMVNKVS